MGLAAWYNGCGPRAVVLRSCATLFLPSPFHSHGVGQANLPLLSKFYKVCVRAGSVTELLGRLHMGILIVYQGV